jgi:Flp pilus assembly protein TadG
MRRRGGFRRGEEGQTLVVIALAVTVLLGAVALGVDAGYGLTQRRVMQNAADAGTIAAAKLLATSVLAVPGPGNTTTYLFGADQQNVYCRALETAQANRSFGFGTLTVTVEYGVVSNTGNPATWDPPTWQAGSSATSCPAPASPSTAVPIATRFVRVRSTTSYHSLFASVVGQPTTVAAAQARAHLTGTSVPVSGPTWPMVRHYNPADFVNDCGNPCDPTSVAPVTFWSSQGSNNPAVYGNFKAATDLSRYSTYYPYTEGGSSNVEQLISATDPSGLQADHSANGNNCPATWDARGDHDPSQHDTTCDVPNWFYYAFGGTLGLDTPWGTPAKPLPAGQSALVPLGNRSVCTGIPSYVSAPSCGNGNDTKGDWIESAGGNLGSNFSSVLRDRIQLNGALTEFSDRPYPNRNQPCIDPGGPNESNCYGKALTMLIFLWDCAEDFNGGNWALVAANRTSTDCSQLDHTGNKLMGTNTNADVHRVHLFTAAPFTFYKALVSTSSIEGFWGGAWGSSSSCPNCTLNPLSNSAYLDGE